MLGAWHQGPAHNSIIGGKWTMWWSLILLQIGDYMWVPIRVFAGVVFNNEYLWESLFNKD